MTEHDEIKLPEIRCGESGFAHRACVISRDYLGRFVCSCPDCEDGEYDCEGFCRATNVHGSGKTALAAIEDYADHFGGVAELTVSEQHV